MGKQEEENEELKRGILLVMGIVVFLSFVYGFGKEGGAEDTVIPG